MCIKELPHEKLQNVLNLLELLPKDLPIKKQNYDKFSKKYKMHFRAVSQNKSTKGILPIDGIGVDYIDSFIQSSKVRTPKRNSKQTDELIDSFT